MRLVYKIITIIISASIICITFNVAVQKGLSKYSIHTKERLTEILVEKENYNTLFIGSSKTHTNIYPLIIDSICNINAYNAGVEGGNLLEFYYIFKAYLINHPNLKNLVLTIDLRSFDLTRKFFNHTIYLNYTNNKIIDEMLSTNGHNTFTFKILPFLLLTEQDDYAKANALKGFMHKTEIPAGDFQYKGFLSNTNKTIPFSLPDTTEKLTKEPIDTLAIKYLSDIIEICKQKKINLIFTCAPEFKQGLQKRCLNANEILSLITYTAKNNNIPLFRHDSLALCQDPLLFANNGHLNTKGAIVYSTILGKQLKYLLKR